MDVDDFRYIWVIRHAKSADPSSGQADIERPLNKRGERDGLAMRTWFSQQAHRAQWVWSSPAVRAKLTAGFVTTGFNATFVEEPSLYLADPETILDCLRGTPEDVQRVAVVAHNPGLTYLVNQLSANHVTDNLVTFGTALFRTPNKWADLSFGTLEFVSLNTPKTI